MSQFDWLGQIPHPEAKTSNKVPEVVEYEKPKTEGYDERGVSYKQFSKKQEGGSYVKVPQLTRFYSLLYQNIASGNQTAARTNANTTVFYCTHIQIDHEIDADCAIIIYDDNTNNARYRAVMSKDEAGQHLTLDLTNCPREFAGSNIIINFSAAVAATKYVHIQLFGWEEEK